MGVATDVKPSGIKWIGDIPYDWECKKIKYLATLKGRIGWQGLTSEEYKDEGPYLITGTDFLDGTINWESCVHITEERWIEAKEIRIKNGDLLITKDGTVGKVAIVKGLEGKASLNSGVLLIKTQENYDKEFLYWVLQSDVFWTWFNYYNSGNSTIIHLYQKDFAEFKYPIPPLIEQKRIADYLSVKCGDIDNVILSMEKQVALLEDYKQTFITEVVTRGLQEDVQLKESGVEFIGNIPCNWSYNKIKYCSTKIGSGKTPLGGADTYEEQGIMFIRSQNVYDDGLYLDDVKFINPATDNEMKVSRVKKDDVLINITGASIGRCCVYDRATPANVNQHVCIIRTMNEVLNPYYLRYVLNSQIGKNQVKICQMGGNRESLTFEQIGLFEVPLPIMNEQNEIVQFLDEKLEKINHVINDKIKSTNTAKDYKKSLIYEFVTGKKRLKGGDNDAYQS